MLHQLSLSLSGKYNSVDRKWHVCNCTHMHSNHTAISTDVLSLHSSFAALIENNEELTYTKCFRMLYTLSYMLAT